MKHTALGYGDYLRFSRLLQERFGLFFSDSRRTELESAILHAFAASPAADLNEYYRLLTELPDGGLEMERLVNAVTVNETYFFRDAAQFDALASTVLPELIEQRRMLRTLRIWSAGCSSGEEPYSIAMLLRDTLPDVDEWSITILGTDVNTAALDRARQGLFGDWAFREPRAKEMRPRYFRRIGARWELSPNVRRMVTFSRLNLAGTEYPSYNTNTMFMDLILCRNVTIYFKEDVTLGVVERFYDALTDGGWLVVGHSELSLNVYRRFEVRNFPNTVLYQRNGQPRPQPAAPRWSPTPPEPIAPIVPQVPVVPPAPIVPTPPPVEANPLEQARELMEFGRSEEARDLLLTLTGSKPVDSEVYILLGQACANLGDLVAAEKWCHEALRRNKLALEAYYTLALVLQHQGRVPEAIEAFKKVVYLDRNDVLGHFSLARLYHQQGQFSAAIKALDNAHRLLETQKDDAIIPRSGGVTVKRLRDAIVRQQQQWVGG
ncbi:MAG TPA: CheR family methyltransferase [Anaerolineae bacterium]|nr:CheR family methyltransferase [Anaerolineae bacterium]HQK12837.1 CheR family methyltransferase [Anaerolineae bacterium]